MGRPIRWAAAIIAFIVGVALLLGVALAIVVDSTVAHGALLPRRASFTAVAANIRSYPAMSRRHYRHDIARLTRIRGHKVVLGTEIMRRHRERALWRALWRSHGYWLAGGSTENHEALTGAVRRVTASSTRIAAKAAGPDSPPRYLTITKGVLDGRPLAALDTHLTNGCFPHNRDRWWYPARCRTNDRERAVIRRIADRLHWAGWTVLVGGDMNTHQRIRWGARQQSVDSGVMQLAILPAPHVRVHVDDVRVIRARRHGGSLFTDHNVPIAHMVLRGIRRPS